MTGKVTRAGMIVGAAVIAAAAGSGNVLLSGSGACGMQKNDAPVAFCETFDQPFPVTNRAGQLDGTLWGVSRITGAGTLWKPSIIDACNGRRTAQPDGTDVIVCNGQLRESTDDNHDVTGLGLYVKQPFDFAGRTGTVAFDVTNNTTGIHGAWPEFWVADQPVPVPLSHDAPCDTCSMPRNAFGIRFAAQQGSCPGGWRADSITISRNYVPEDRGIFDNNSTGAQIRVTGNCASLSSGPNGGLNHVELRISQARIDVYASDAGSTTLKLINTVTNANLSFTRGVIWITDAHYNAEKALQIDPSLANLTNNTFTWDNVAFDGPAPYRDLSFDVLDKLAPVTSGGVNLLDLGWDTTASNPVHLTTLPMTQANIDTANANGRGPLLMFNFGLYTTPTIFNYTINGHAETPVNSPLPSALLRSNRSLALPVPIEHLVPGPQNIVLWSDQPITVFNVNVVLIAGASVPNGAQAPNAPINLRIQ